MNSIDNGLRNGEPETPEAASPGRDTTHDVQIGGLLDSLSGQVTVAFSQLGALHDELCAKRRAAEEREAELRHRSDRLDKEVVDLDRLRLSLTTTEDELKSRCTMLERQEREVSEQRSAVAYEAQRLAEIESDLTARTALLDRRERVIDALYALLGRMQNAMVTPSEENLAAATAIVEHVEQRMNEPLPTELVEADAPLVQSSDAQWYGLVGPDAPLQSSPETESSETDTGPTIDLSDFSEEELEAFGVRRRLRAYSDAFLAAEIRSERGLAKKRRGWF